MGWNLARFVIPLIAIQKGITTDMVKLGGASSATNVDLKK